MVHLFALWLLRSLNPTNVSVKVNLLVQKNASKDLDYVKFLFDASQDFVPCQYKSMLSFSRDTVFDAAMTVLHNIVRLNIDQTGYMYCIFISGFPVLYFVLRIL